MDPVAALTRLGGIAATRALLALTTRRQLRSALRSAALAHGWAPKTVPQRPEVAIRTKRHVAAARRAGVRVLWVDLRPQDVVDGVTSPLRTCLDCARRLPFDEARVPAAYAACSPPRTGGLRTRSSRC